MSGRPERILVVSPYPPMRDGIAAYAMQQVAALRRDGHDVEVVSPYPSAAHHHLDLVGPNGAVALGRLARRFDRVVIHFHPDVFYPDPATPGFRVMEGLALGAALRTGPEIEVRLHEVDYRWGRGGPAAAATRWLWRGVDRVTVHTEAQRRDLVDAFGLDAGKVELVEHGADFVPRTTATRAEARQSLGVGPDEHLFLCIGFVQPHKGFDRAIRAFAAAGLGAAGCRLAVVGSVRVDDPAVADHADELRRLAAATPGVELHLGFVSDEEFDRWIVASDVVVLPYRHIWSSSVLERAALFRRKVIVTAVGGLPDQVAGRPDTVLVDDDNALAHAMRAAADRAGTAATTTSGPAAAWSVERPATRAGVMAEVRRRAAVARGGPVVRAEPGGRPRPATAAAATAAVVDATAPLRRLRPVVPPKAVSARPGVSALKRLIRRLIAWELDPVVAQVNRLQQATIEAVATHQAAHEERTDPDG